MARAPDRYEVRWPTLWVVPAWIEAHCPVPDGFHRGKPLELAQWQLWCTVNHYRVRTDAEWVPENPLRASAFENRRSQVVGPQKLGKGPWSACVIANEAVGPALFAGWAGKDDGYACSDWGCSCGWEYQYERGEPMGMSWPTPLIQLTASSKDQVKNVYGPLTEMIALGPLAERMLIRQSFIRCPGRGEIWPVTSSAKSRLGNPVTFVLQDETGLYTKQNGLDDVADTQLRGLAGMGGRSMETTNPWDPSKNSTAQQTYTIDSDDVFKHYEAPPSELKYANLEDRRKIHEFNYAGCPWIEIDAIDAQADETEKKHPGQAERFFGNRIVQGEGVWLPDGLWDEHAKPRELVGAR